MHRQIRSLLLEEAVHGQNPHPSRGRGALGTACRRRGTCFDPRSRHSRHTRRRLVELSRPFGLCRLRRQHPRQLPLPEPLERLAERDLRGLHERLFLRPGAVLVRNASSSSVTVNSVQIQFNAPGDTTNCIYNIWPQNVTLPAGHSLIVTQTASYGSAGCTPSIGSMDSSDIGPNASTWSSCSQSG